MIAIELAAVRKVFNEGRPGEMTAVDGVTLSITPGMVTVIEGPSGSGKTTLLALAGAMTRPTEGRIRVGGREISTLPERFLTELRRTTFGFIFQNLHLVRGVTVLENTMLPGFPTGEGWSSLRSRARGLLDSLGLAARAGARAEWLSGGEAQRAAIARALINDPPVIIADEPTAHLDSVLSREFMQVVEGFRRGGKTVVIASHDPLVIGAEGVGRRVAMRDGRLEGAGA